MSVLEMILDSWRKQAGIVERLAELVNEGNRGVKPSEDGMALDMQLAHIHQVRRGWLRAISPEVVAGFEPAVDVVGEDWIPLKDLDLIRARLKDSAAAVEQVFLEGMEAEGGRIGPYENPVLFLQHMVWHEGWHAGLIMLGLRLAGEEPSEEWEELNVWAQWRDAEI